ncbi:uncharacterized protein LOC125024028 [Mugil cephalus]|uniref:uncharacterized protein LOC125024028 n=1 Tax=Mugil cephalus TaxID=48193 RepID=UPI001FB5F3C9|nr:uncharacterized protein LOC125024028 [Mugil cephalus]
MEKQTQSQNTIFSRLNPPQYEHLKPLSSYSRMITCDQSSSLHQAGEFSNPFINFKIEVVNIGANKRKLDYSSSDDGYETPAKLPYSPTALSPDLGCFMDYCSPAASHDSVPPVANTNPAYLEAQGARSEIKQTRHFRQLSDRVGSGSSTDPRREQETVPRNLKNGRVLVNAAPAFDHDVNDILCLNPFSTYTAGEISDKVDASKNPAGNTFPRKPLLIPTVAHGKGKETRAGQVEKGQGELRKVKKEMCVTLKDMAEDKGYFTMSYRNERKAGKTLPQPIARRPPTANPVPLLRTVETEPPEDECHPERLSEPRCRDQALVSGQCFSFTEDVLCGTVGRLTEPVNFPVESLEGEDAELWRIGPPVFESSICQSVTVELDAASEQNRQVSEKVQVGATGTVHECQDSLSGQGTTLDTSYETTLPLQVQVKSKVVLSNQHTSKPKAPLPAGSNTKPTKPNEDTAGQTAKCRARKRPVVFSREEDWEVEKRKYVNSVISHMNEKPGAAKGVLFELSNLMTNVADENMNSKEWQHPSDLSCRNYQKHLGSAPPKMTLNSWMAKNGVTYRRFENVPKIFERSYVQ